MALVRKDAPSTGKVTEAQFRLPGRLAGFVRESWSAVLVSASLALIIDHLGLLTVVSKVSLLLVSNLAAQRIDVPTSFDRGPYVVAIGAADFQERYRERSPIDHCLLTSDLARVLAQRPVQLAVDFDLSPPGMPDAADLACQAKLDALLDAHASQMVQIMPEPVASPRLREAKLAWLEARCAAGVRFASPYVERSLRMVIDQRVDARDSLAFLVHDPRAPSLCEALHADRQAFVSAWLDPEGSVLAHRDSHGEREPINFALAAGQVPAPMAANAPARWPSFAGKAVFFGGIWGRDDTYGTPLGEQAGVWIHAARLFTLDHPVQPVPPLIAFALDMLVGFAFALLIGGLWRLYLWLRIVEYDEMASAKWHCLSLMRTVTSRYRLASTWSSLVLLAFVLAYVLLCLSFFVMARYLFVQWGVLIAPLVMAVSMLFDGFMSGPVEVLTGHIVQTHSRSASISQPPHPRSLRSRALIASVFVLLGWLTFMALVNLAGQPGKWLTIVLLSLLAALTALAVIGLLRPKAEEVGEVINVIAETEPERGVHRFIAGLGQLVGLLRNVVFIGVVLYAFWILLPF